MTDDRTLPAGWYALTPIAAYTCLDDARALLPKMCERGEVLLADAIARQLDQLDGLHAGAGFVGLGSRVLVIEKLPDGSALCLTTTEDTRADNPGEALERAVVAGLVGPNAMAVRYCQALPPGHLPASAKPPSATAH